jgi:hypothetical protein
MLDYEDTELVIGKKYYEVAKLTQITGDDFESVDSYTQENYRQAVRVAKKVSLEFGAADVVCYTPTEDTYYHTIWFERYINGEKQYRCEL